MTGQSFQRRDIMELVQVLKERRTVRKFLQKMIPDEELRHLIDMGRLASSGANSQRLRYVVIRTPELVGKIFPLTAWAASVTPRRIPVPGVTSPVAFIAVTAAAELAEDPVVQTDCGAAVQTIQLAAWEKGIGCCWMGAIDREKIHALLELPQETAVLYLIALGYAAERPVSEDSDDAGKIKYYLDQNDQLHVPKLSVEVLTQWK